MLPRAVSHIETNEDGQQALHWGYDVTRCWCGRVNVHLRGQPLLACLGVHKSPVTKEQGDGSD